MSIAVSVAVSIPSATISSGCAENPGNDILITLGSWNLNTDSIENSNMLLNFQAGTIMHEFGHNLGLKHGGDEDINYKPNYLSIMNYLYQLEGLATIGNNEGDRYYDNKGCDTGPRINPFWGDPDNFIVDYSHGLGSDLDENNGILEENGLGYPSSGPVDYNCNNNVNETLLNYNVNPSYNTQITNLHDYNDWNALNIIFARTYSGNLGNSYINKKNNLFNINVIMNDLQPVANEPKITIPRIRR